MNEDDADADGVTNYELGEMNYEYSMAAEPQAEYKVNLYSRDKLEEYIRDYNQLFGDNFTTKDPQSYYNYYNDISEKK